MNKSLNFHTVKLIRNNGQSFKKANDLQHIFPAVLCMLKNDRAWSK